MNRPLAALLAAVLTASAAHAQPSGRSGPVRPSAGPLFNFSVSASPAPASGVVTGPLALPGAPLGLPSPVVTSASLAQPAALKPGVAIVGAAARGVASAAARPKDAKAAVGAQAMKQLGGLAARPAGPKGRQSAPGAAWTLGVQAFDGGASRMRDDSGPVLAPAFEPPTARTPAPETLVETPAKGDDEINPGETLSFQPAQKTALLATSKDQAIWGIVKRIRDNDGSRAYWGAYKKGNEVEIVSRGEPIFGRPTTITSAATTPLGKLTRGDFEGIVPKAMLQLGVKKLRDGLRAQLEETRRRFNENDPPVGPSTPVRVVKFKSFLELYRETHGATSRPEPEAPAARNPLKIKPEGALAPLERILPKAVYLDLDMLAEPAGRELLSDIAKLQRTGVYFIGLSRKPASESLARFLKNMSAYQQSILMPIRFLAATDDGAVISAFAKGGLQPVETVSLRDADLEVLRDAAQKASEATGTSPKSVKELPPYSLGVNESGRQLEPGKRVRFEVSLPKSLSEAQAEAWAKAFEGRSAQAGLSFPVSRERRGDGAWIVAARTSSLGSSMDRVARAAGERFGLYMNPGDAVVLSHDPAIQKAHPQMDLPKLTGLSGVELVDNVLGLVLGEHRDNREGDLAGSASRMSQFSRDKKRYLQEALMKQDSEEQNINFFSGHMVHAVNDWLVYELQNGRVPSVEEYSAKLGAQWEAGLREFKPVGLPSGETHENWLEASTTRAISMYKWIVRTHRRGEILVGTEIPNFFIVKDYARRSGELKRRYILHTIFDFIALRPDPERPGHATLVIYDFKTGPAKSRRRLDKDVQVLTYALFASDKWVGREFPTPYLSGGKPYVIDTAEVEFIYNAVKQPTEVHRWDLDKVRSKIIGTLNRIHAAESKMLGLEAPKAKTAKGRKAAAKAPKKTAKRTK